MVTIRLSRVGKKNHPLFRIVVQDKQKDPYGPALDIVGFYNPHTSPSTVELKEDLIKDWISKGAQPSNTVWNLLVNAGVIEGKKKKSVSISKKRAAKDAEAKKGGEEAPKEAKSEEAPAEAPAEEAPKEEVKEETKEEVKEEAPKEAPKEEAPEEKPAEEAPKE